MKKAATKYNHICTKWAYLAAPRRCYDWKNENLHKITAQRIIGASDMVVEVTSPGTAAYDRLSKRVLNCGC